MSIEIVLWSIAAPGIFLAGIALGIWAHVVAGRIETEYRAQRMATLLAQRQEAAERRMREMRERELPLSASEDRRQVEEYAPELREMLGIDGDGEGKPKGKRP